MKLNGVERIAGLGLMASLAFLAGCESVDYSEDGDDGGESCASLGEAECLEASSCEAIYAPGRCGEATESEGFVGGDQAPGERRCDAVFTACEAIEGPESCQSDADCAEGFACELAPSQEDCLCASCAPGEDCEPCSCGGPVVGEGQCVPVAVSCFEDSDCGRGERCEFGLEGGRQPAPDDGADICVCPDCEEGSDCPPCECGGGEGPSREEGVCVEDLRECYSDGDCGRDEYCSFDEGQGERPEPAPCACDCEPGTDCDCACEDPGFVAPAGVCVERPLVYCYDDSDCGHGQICEAREGDGESDELCDCAPCDEDDENCAPCNCGAPAPRPEGVCVDAQVQECESDTDCPGGYCVFDCDGSDACGSRCIPLGCDDGSDVLCDALPPECPEGLIVAARGGCWACVDPQSCEEPGQTCEGAWLDERGECRGPNDGSLPLECCQMPEGLYNSGRVMDDCAPHDGPALTFVLADAPLACGIDPQEAGDRIELSIWDSQILSGGHVSLNDGFAGTVARCVGERCAPIREGEFSFRSTGFDASPYIGYFFFVLEDGQAITGEFEVPYCQGFPGCG